MSVVVGVQMEFTYQLVASKPEFRVFVLEMLQRLGVSEYQLCDKRAVMLEFAKCFVTPNADPHFNYGLYHIAGGTYLNGSITMFFLEQIQKAISRKKRENEQVGIPFKPSTMIVDYFTRLKAKYISNNEFTTISQLYGFEEFIQYEKDRDGKEIRYLVNGENIESSVFQAFMGCFECIVDRYVENYHSHMYTSNFVTTIFKQLEINYQPSHVYDIITLLKETNDYVKLTKNVQYQIEQIPPTLPYTYVKKDNKKDFLDIYSAYILTPDGKTILQQIPIGQLPKSEENLIIMSQRLYDWLKSEGIRVRSPPTVEELNIDFLIKK